VLAFVAFVPWLRTLDAAPGLRSALLLGCAMSVAYVAAGLPWLASAIGSYTGIGTPPALLLLLVAAPLLQPQFLAFALVRQGVSRQRPVLRALAAASAWAATEYWVPRLLDDTFGYVLYPSRVLRQAADAVGVAGLTFMLLLVNESLAATLARTRLGARAVLAPLAVAAAVPLLLAGYGAHALGSQAAAGPPMRLGLVQSNIVDYERLRREKGAGAVVREVLDTHYAMSYDAVERQHADAVLWSETVYPTTFGHPKSEAGAELDREILEIVNAAGVPFVFGTYDRDASGEYNAAAFVAPGAGLLGFYRKTRPFPLTEYVPPWLDGPALRQGLPWAGTWKPGTGPRVFPLRLKDGREVPVLPLICLDDVDTDLAIGGARLGAQAILTLSNDAWFTAAPQGARLHLAAAAFRSVETGLPQFRVTSNGYSAVIDTTGTVVASSRMGERTLVIGHAPVGEPPRTLMVRWGNWVGLAATAFLVLLAGVAAARRWWTPRDAHDAAGLASLPARVVVLPPAARAVAAALRVLARGSLPIMAAVVLWGDGPLQANTLAQMRAFAAFFVAPEAAAWCVLRAFSARAAIANGHLVLARGRQSLRLALRDIALVQPWRLPWPAAGAWLRLTSGARWPYGLLVSDPAAFSATLAAAGASLPPPPTGAWWAVLQARARTPHGRHDHPFTKFFLLPLVLAIPAFRLHQHIAYGSGVGELYTFGLQAYAMAFALWWAAWAMGVALFAAVLRGLIESGAIAGGLLRPASALPARIWLERAGHLALYAGLPGWLLLRLLAP
jgi:apolipoprotein N-acyltransferase